MLRPKIKEYYDIVPEAEDRYQVRSSEVVSVLKGATVKDVLVHLFPLLDGRHSIEEIVNKLSDVASQEVLHGVLEKLIKLRIVEDASERDDSGLSPQEVERYRRQLMFLDISLDEGTDLQYQRNIKESRLSIVGEGDLAVSIARQAVRVGIGRVTGINLKDGRRIGEENPDVSFNQAGIDLLDERSISLAIEQEKPSLIVVAADRAEPSLLKWMNELTQRLRISLLYCEISGTEGVIGPFVLPGQTACLMCQHLRVTRNLDFYQEYRSWEKWVTTDGARSRAQTGSLSPFTEMVAGMASLEVFKHVSSFHEPETYGKFLTVNALSYEITSHEVLRVPRCPACGNARTRPTFSVWQGV